MPEKKSTVEQRYRNFACVVYPDSAPENWQDILSDLHIPAFISPLHDKDINPTGEPKKPHWHVVLMFEGKKSISQIEEYTTLFGGVGHEVVKSIRGYGRYLCHLDNPEKAQYPIEGVRALCGADYVGVIGLAVDKYKAIGEMVDFCNEFSIYSFADLLEYSKNERFDWFRILCDNGAIVMKEFLKSKSWTDGKKTNEG